MKTDDKLEDSQNIINEQKPSYYKNTEIISKIQKIKKIKKREEFKKKTNIRKRNIIFKKSNRRNEKNY